MPFHFGRLWRDIFSSLRHVPVTGKRLRFLVWFFLLFPVIVLSGWFGFLIDNIFYRRYLKQKIEKPLFIIGNFRSGSTLLQRLIAIDEEHFAGMKSWEIYTAPSIAMRKAFRGISTVDSWFGKPLKRAMFRWERRVLKTIRKHPVGVMEYEEDEGLFLFIWAGIVRWFFYPSKNHDENYHFFDTRVKEWRKKRFMKYYLRCIRRHVYYRGGRHYLSKNPTSTSKIKSILEFMPDARFVYLVRNPYDLLPSNFDFFQYVWKYFSDFPSQYPYSDLLLEMTKHFYEYPLEVFSALPEHQYHIVRFDDLVKDPVGTVREIYAKLEYPLTEGCEEKLIEEARSSHKHKGNRKITIRDIGVSRDYVRTHYRSILQRFKFREDTRPGA